ncbi:T9SS type A sorting domain-containing protein [Hymenobacter sp. BT770]|uniref:T9SS type A sorting domain-containing protein n=1 Tax=Hymenobacter sp. BT770 TaxID=2886942 RepID=UPI001D106A15|nr:T9SS type A sorting domain-containing protein [Hymenobacter sp. BT770]MCC3154235.1 T9SS type A sorting domain-containing protein [Hymenobacter sp. BT770]MDO3416385.1 T9SS type A sorting domain-containing protein [Hymenobacter sp. BT770]
MKTLLHTLLAFSAGLCQLVAAPAQAQTFPNSSLDTWASRNGVEAPTNWQTTDDVVAAVLGTRIPTNTVTKTTTVHGGPFAAQLQTQSVLGQAIQGSIILGNSIHGGADLAGGLPFTARPTSIQFYYQLSGARALTDSAAMGVQLTRRVNGVAQVVAQAEYLFTSLAGNYTLVTLPMQYLSALAPDSVSMIFLSGTAKTITAGTILRIDDIAFAGGATATRDAALAAALSVSPNPSPDGRYTLHATEPALLAGPLTVLDASGRVVRHEAAASPATTRRLDLDDLARGLYTLQVFTGKGLITKKLVVQ